MRILFKSVSSLKKKNEENEGKKTQIDLRPILKTRG